MSGEGAGTPRPLRRSLGVWSLAFYGIGTILGAGIYVLVGEIAARAGSAAPVSFAVAGVLAVLTAMSFAELSARFPKSAGEAIYVNEAFGLPALSVVVGLLIATTGIVSAATIVVGFHGYLSVFVEAPHWLTTTLLLAGMTALACWGIRESVTAAVAITLVEIGGLVFVIVVGLGGDQQSDVSWSDMLPAADLDAWHGVLIGSFIAFYAFIGFEDMVNVAEEVVEPERTMPRAILAAIAIATVLYLIVAVVAVLVLPMSQLAGSEAPLADVYRASTGREPVLITVISMLAVSNGALIQIIMSARVLYGLSNEGWLPRRLGRVNSKTQTPLLATLLIGVVIAGLAVALPLATLAQITSLIILMVFSLINLSLWLIKRARPTQEGVVSFPSWISLVAAIACVGLLAVRAAAAMT